MSDVTFCTRRSGHDGPCNGLEPEECLMNRLRREATDTSGMRALALEIASVRKDAVSDFLHKVMRENAELRSALEAVATEADTYGCNHEDEQDEDERLCGGDDCKRCYLLKIARPALTGNATEEATKGNKK